MSYELRRVLARNIRVFAQERGIGLNALADEAGISRGTIHYLTTSQTAATVDTLQKVADGLGVKASELLCDHRVLPSGT